MSISSTYADRFRQVRGRGWPVSRSGELCAYIIHEPVNLALCTIAGGRSLLLQQYPINLAISIAILFLVETPARKWISARFATIGRSIRHARYR